MMQFHILFLNSTMHSRPLVLCCLYMIFFISKCNSTSQNSDFVSCSKAGKCGSFTSIPYPFSASKGCGHPGFLLECHNNETLFLKINHGVYRVLSFHDPLRSNEKPSINIGDENVFRYPCGFPITTFNPRGSRFTVAHEDYKVMANLLIDCPKFGQLQGIYSPCNNSCSWTRKHHCYFVYSYENGYEQLNAMTEQCDVIKVPLQNNTRANKKPLHALLLEGFQVEWNEIDDHFVKCEGCMASGGLCGYNDLQPFVCYCGNGTHYKNCQEGNKNSGGTSGNMNGAGTSAACKFHLGVIIGGSIGCMLVILIAVTYLAIYMRKQAPPSSPHSFHADDIKLALSTLSLPVFKYKDLEAATNNFDESKQLGDGGFGCVYQATLGNGQVAAVKRLYPENTRRTEQFVNEVKILSSLSHPNLIRLMGFCQCRHDLLLVYEYVPNGTLADHLHGKKKTPHGLPWKTRIDIALQIARALEYLHFSNPPVFHRDIKSSNILLDMKFRVKVADFGLCKLLSTEASHVSTIPQGTPGYLDPDYNETFQLTSKSDVYSFGVVLFEIISGMKAVATTTNRREINLACLVISNIQHGTLHDIIDPGLGIESDPLVRAMVRRVCEVGFACLALRKDDRPDMMEVVVQLEQIRRIGYGSAELFYTEKDEI